MGVTDFLDDQRDHLDAQAFELLSGFFNHPPIEGVALPENLVDVEFADDGT